MIKKFVWLLVLFSLFSAWASDSTSHTPEPYDDKEFPGFMHDLRRAEIITLGAMPFITFNVSMAYSFGNYACHGFDSSYFVNPFSKESNGYSTDEQVGIILTSIGISAGIGLTDFIVHSVKRSRQTKKLKKQKNREIEISPIQNDPDAVKLEKPSDNKESSETVSENNAPEQENSALPQKEVKTIKELKVVSQ